MRFGLWLVAVGNDINILTYAASRPSPSACAGSSVRVQLPPQRLGYISIHISNMSLPENPRNEPGQGLQSLIRPRTRNRMSKDLSTDYALGERNINVQKVPLLPPDHPSSKARGEENISPEQQRRSRSRDRARDGKDHKRSKSTVSLRSLVGGGESKKSSKSKDRGRQEQSQSPKKMLTMSKSSTGLSALFGKRNKSSKDLATTSAADRHEEQVPAASGSSPVDTPIWAQFASPRTQLGSRGSESSAASGRDATRPARPLSMFAELQRHTSGSSAEQPNPQDIAVTKRGSRVAAAVAAINNKTTSPQKAEPQLDPDQVERAFEEVLERRNIPEDQRRSMRSLTLHIKADFVKQDGKSSRPSSPVKGNSLSRLDSSSDEQTEEAVSPSKRDRPRSRAFTFTKSDRSPSKKQRSNSRPCSTQDTMQLGQDASTSSGGSRERSSSRSRSGAPTALPEEYVAHLKAMHDPVQAEVGRVHKLRILLRNETVEWVDSFIELGGMTEIIGLLQRIMAIEWRDDHEDQLLHETLLCLKGISTTRVAQQELANVADDLFPRLLHMLFDEEKKGPSEFTTRGIIITILCEFPRLASLLPTNTNPVTYLSSALPSASTRATQILQYLEDTSPSVPLPFVAEMHTRRPYRAWCRETTNVTKEVFWIFLHHTNIITPEDDPSSSTSPTSSYTTRHFPGTRAPVPAAPYIGGVEWDATMYLAAHLDLLNGLVAAVSEDAAGRNALRDDLRASGWEKVMGRTLRTCKEKFYGAVHEGLRCWVAAAEEDGWGVEFVATGRGIGVEGLASPVKSAGERGRVELPSLGLGGGREEKKGDLEGWLV